MCMQLINIYTIGSPQGIGGFFPQGLQGVIKTPTGFDQVAGGLDTYPVTANAYTTGQVRLIRLNFRCTKAISRFRKASWGP